MSDHITDDAATWAWFLEFAGRFPELGDTPYAMGFLVRCRDAALQGGGWLPAEPRRTGWYRAAGRDGRDLIDLAWSTALLHGGRGPGAGHDALPTGQRLIEHMSRAYPPPTCALGGSRPLAATVRRWGDGTVVRLAAAVHAGEAGAGLLADALLDAGCADDALVAHLRGDDQHPPYCWAVRSVLRAAPARRRGRGGATSGAPAGPAGVAGAPDVAPRPVRLGRVERLVLRSLAAGVTPDRAAMTRAERESLRRALLRLTSLGFITAGGGPLLTALGQWVTSAYRRELEGGARIRWVPRAGRDGAG
jgi:hypothetical protein